MWRIAVLMTCHNRRETTLRCLSAFRAAMASAASKGLQLSFDLFIVDDGSTDGTSEAVREYAGKAKGEPAWAIHLIQGDGRLYWAKGMARAWREALNYESSLRSSPSDFDFFLWLNDDTILYSDSLVRVIKTARGANGAANGVVVGSLIDEATGTKTCGVKSDGLFTGNFVLVPRVAYEQIGLLCDSFHHAWADSDYAMRCRRAGVNVVELENVGTTRAHDFRPSLKGVGLGQRWRMLWNPKGWCVHDLWLYRRRNWGLGAAVWSSLHLICHVLKGEE